METGVGENDPSMGFASPALQSIPHPQTAVSSISMETWQRTQQSVQEMSDHEDWTWRTRSIHELYNSSATIDGTSRSRLLLH